MNEMDLVLASLLRRNCKMTEDAIIKDTGLRRSQVGNALHRLQLRSLARCADSFDPSKRGGQAGVRRWGGSSFIGLWEAVPDNSGPDQVKHVEDPCIQSEPTAPMSETTFFEIILQSADFNFEGRDEIEDPLDEALQQANLGEVTGGGSGMGVSNIDVEVTNPEQGLIVIRQVLQSLEVAKSTVIRQSGSPSIRHPVYQSAPSNR